MFSQPWGAENSFVYTSKNTTKLHKSDGHFVLVVLIIKMTHESLHRWVGN